MFPKKEHESDGSVMDLYLMVIILSPFLSFCLSTSMCAPVTSWIAVMLQPPLPMMRETTEAGTESFFDLETEQL